MKYGDYLQLDRLLSAQKLESQSRSEPAHDEMLFIITHQAYELWFKQIVFELSSVIDIFDSSVLDDKKIAVANSRLERMISIQRVLVHQIDVIETMTPLDFLEFRDLLIPASGFQSMQFKSIEIMLGLKKSQRIPADQDFFRTRYTDSEREELEKLEGKKSLLFLLEEWLKRIPFLDFHGFDFWQAYRSAAVEMFDSEREIIQSNEDLSEGEVTAQIAGLERTRNSFESLCSKNDPESFHDHHDFKMNQKAVLAALFIHLYRDEPILNIPFQMLTNLVAIDELWTTWRQRHALMVQRMLGTRIGTGGSAGHDYLKKTTERNRVFGDLFLLSSFLIPRSRLPELPETIRRQLGFFFQP